MQNLNQAKPLVKQVISDVFYANVVNIISPGHLYIQSVDRVDEIRALFDKMQQFHEKPNFQKIFYPHLQMDCAVCIDDTWYRARIEAHRPNCVVELFLVDIGKHVDIEWRFLRTLDEKFKSLQEGVTKCSLVDIAPKNNQQDWGTDATLELKRLCKNKLKVIVCETRSKFVKIELFIVKKTVNFQINAYLAKHDLVKWIGDLEMIVERVNDSNSDVLNESAMSAAIKKRESQREFRQTIKILDIASPSKFYLTLIKYESAINKMHTEIQSTMKSYKDEQQTLQWKVGDHCLVNAKFSTDGKKSWYRGRIETYIDNDHYQVFLRDRGLVVFAALSDIVNITPALSNVIDGSSKCHLANIQPTSSHWANAAIDEFKHMTISGEEYDTFSVSVYGEMKDDSLPVYLWGRKKPTRVDPLQGSPMIWTNINEIFASKGYADCLEKFKTIVDCDTIDVQIKYKEMTDFNMWHDKILNLKTDNQIPAKQSSLTCDNDDFVLEAELDIDHENFCYEKVVSWLPAKPLSRYNFHACPTYVDNNAIIYLHEQSQSEYLKQLMFTINKVIAGIKYDKSYKWKKYEPCMVKYHLDECFYRGVVKEVLPNKLYKVEFVDYGNIELCESKDLRLANVLGHVPIQASKIYLAFVKPISEDGTWNKKILEFIHVTIVNKLCYVRVEDNIEDEFVPCTVTVGAMDLIKTLVAEKLAEPDTDLKVKLNLPETYDFYESKNNNRDADLYKESSVDLDQFKETIEKKNAAKKNKELLCKYDLNLSLDYLVEDSDVEVLQQNNTFHRDALEYDIAFRPLDTSTTISNAVKSFSLLPFQPIKLTQDVTKFPCKVYEVLDTLHLFVEPMIEEYTDHFCKMEKKLKKYGIKMPKDFDVCDSRFCLAPYSKDKCYYRAVITDQISKTHVRIRFVDYLNEEVVECESLRECPDELVNKPLKHLIVKLHGVKPTKRVRESDIKRELDNLLGETVIAFVVKNDTIPVVRLYNKDDSNVLAYKSMIDLNFFTEIRD